MFSFFAIYPIHVSHYAASASCRISLTDVWMDSGSGSFTTKSAWDVIRQKVRLSSFETTALQQLWHPSVPKKLSFFTLRAIYKSIPVDTAIQKLGIPFASACHCCLQPSEESVDHLLLSGDLAVRVWSYFADLLNIQSLPQSVLLRCFCFFTRFPKSSALHFLMSALPPSATEDLKQSFISN